ncbi:MAG: hypothetical protein R2707_12530 [Acidimicrobiales bacterium]
MKSGGLTTAWRRFPSGLPALAGVASVLCLLAPWARSGRVDRSTIDLLSSASALALWDGGEEYLALASWYLLPLLAAGAIVAAAWGRSRFSARCVVPIGPLMALAWLAVVRSPFDARWGALLGTVLGLIATVLAGLLLMRTRKPAEGTT